MCDVEHSTGHEDERVRQGRLEIGRGAVRFIFDQEIEIMDALAEQYLIDIGAGVEFFGLRHTADQKRGLEGGTN